MTSHASTFLARDSAPDLISGSETSDQNTTPSQNTTADGNPTASQEARSPETRLPETTCELAPNISDVEALIQEATVSAMHLRLAARIIVRGAARLASGYTRELDARVTQD